MHLLPIILNESYARHGRSLLLLVPDKSVRLRFMPGRSFQLIAGFEPSSNEACLAMAQNESPKNASLSRSRNWQNITGPTPHAQRVPYLLRGNLAS